MPSTRSGGGPATASPGKKAVAVKKTIKKKGKGSAAAPAKARSKRKSAARSTPAAVSPASTPLTVLTVTELAAATVSELKVLCTDYAVDPHGVKAVLVKRLEALMRPSSSSSSTAISGLAAPTFSVADLVASDSALMMQAHTHFSSLSRSALVKLCRAQTPAVKVDAAEPASALVIKLVVAASAAAATVASAASVSTTPTKKVAKKSPASALSASAAAGDGDDEGSGSGSGDEGDEGEEDMAWDEGGDDGEDGAALEEMLDVGSITIEMYNFCRAGVGGLERRVIVAVISGIYNAIPNYPAISITGLARYEVKMGTRLQYDASGNKYKDDEGLDLLDKGTFYLFETYMGDVYRRGVVARMYVAYKRFSTHLQVKVSNLLTLDEFEMGFDTLFEACVKKTISSDERKGMVKRRVERHKEMARAGTPGGGESSNGKEAAQLKWVSEQYLPLLQEAAEVMFVDLQTVMGPLAAKRMATAVQLPAGAVFSEDVRAQPDVVTSFQDGRGSVVSFPARLS